MEIEKVPYGGWENCLKLSNSCIEAFVTTRVGPRILSFRLQGGRNVFKEFEDQRGGTGESQWSIRGGHRLWIAPESYLNTYALDNEEVPYQLHPPSTVTLSLDGTIEFPVRKELVITISQSAPRLRVDHRLTNDGDYPITVAPWALSVMDTGCTAILPQPALGEHPLDLAPNRRWIFWPFTDPADARFQVGSKYLRVQQDQAISAPFKLGLSHQVGWVVGVVNDALFLKTVEYQDEAVYPDGGSNFELFTNHQILELETLGELRLMEPGESLALTESWWLYPVKSPLPDEDSALREWLRPFIELCGLHLP